MSCRGRPALGLRETPSRHDGQPRPVSLIIAFLAGTAATLAFFAFFPGLPHVVDWGAILVALVIGSVARWARQTRITKKHADAP